jgi:hypothetical protein
MLTGWRSGEAQALRWSEIDFTRRTARLADTKTGLSVRPLSYAACDVLRTMPRHSADRVFPATRGEGPMVGFKKFWPKRQGPEVQILSLRPSNSKGLLIRKTALCGAFAPLALLAALFASVASAAVPDPSHAWCCRKQEPRRDLRLRWLTGQRL